jgi:NADPH:quinone reductase-like Zn-dependent oxidoreductase
MRGAVVRDHELRVVEIDAPSPSGAQALIRNAASSINQGEVRGIRSAPHWQLSAANGHWVPGWDFAGTIETAAADGRGPRAGARVVGWVRQGAWAERVAAEVDQLVELPDDVSFRDASTLPIAGLTAWHALRLARLARGKKVLVLGANGGVGRFALQIARAAGAATVGVVTSETKRGSVADLADDVSIGLPAEGAFDIILECVGGPTLADCFRLVAPYATIVSYGNASGEQTCFEPGAAFRKPCFSLQSFALYDELARRPSNAEGLDELVSMLADGRIRTEVALEVELDRIQEACDALMARKVDGKAVVRIAAP